MHSLRLFACLLGLTFISPDLHAHQVPSVELEFLESEGQVSLEGEMDIAYMLPETRNIPGGPPLSRAAVMKSSPDEFARIRRDTETTLRKLIRFTYADKEVSWQVEFPDFKKTPFALPPEAGDIALITTRFRITPFKGPGELRIHWAGEQETELIVLTEEGDNPRPPVSTLPGGSLMLLKKTGGGESAPVQTPVTGGWLQLGFHHVLGLDHILFILGLFLLSPAWKPLVRQSLLFTLAHSITLALAVLGVLKVPGNWVEHLIALSIAWVGIENLFIRKLNRQRMILVFCFGLLHGLGFASVLAVKLDGIPRNQLIGPLLGFNVGVELAQISIFLAAFSLLWPIRKWTLQVRIIGSVIIGVAGIAWAIQQIAFPGAVLF